MAFERLFATRCRDWHSYPCSSLPYTINSRCRCVSLNLPFVRFLGVLSYSLYLCHSIILESIKSVWTSNPVLASGVSLACALAFATLVHYCIERPSTRIRKRLSMVLKA